MYKNLVVDLNNIVIVKRYGLYPNKVQASKKCKRFIPTMFNMVVRDILNTAQRTGCKSIMLTHDSKGSLRWRRDIYPNYKVSESVNDDVYREDIYTVIELITEWFDTFTAASYIKCETAEADDIISVWTAANNGVDVIMSTDKDYIQLVNENTLLYNPVTREYRESDDPKYDLFLKCFRGDKSDNVPNIYKRLRETVIKDAYHDTIAKMNLFYDKNPDGMIVADLFERNNRLMNLHRIPEHIETDIIGVIFDKINRTIKFNELKSRNWVGQNVGDMAHNEINANVSLSTPCILN